MYGQIEQGLLHLNIPFLTLEGLVLVGGGRWEVGGEIQLHIYKK